MTVAVLHAYSRSNLGDGLLVDLTVARLARVGVDRSSIRLFSLDAASFPEFADRVQVGVASRSVDAALIRALPRSLAAMGSAVVGARRTNVPRWGAVASGLADVDAIVAVGGAYLRAGTMTEQGGLAVNHLAQVAQAAVSSAPSLYLPQSVGPLRGPVGALTRRVLAGVDHVLVRDPRSAEEISGRNVTQTPDLAVLEIADRRPPPSDPGGPVLAIARPTSGRDAHLGVLALRDRLGSRARWAVQTAGTADKSDADFYDRIGIESCGATDEVVAGGVSAGVSIRLHGALMAIGAGVPMVHLAYQRKGWAAMDQLGLGEFVHDADGFDPDLVAEQVIALADDPSRYWRAVDAARPGLSAASAGLDALVARTVGA